MAILDTIKEVASIAQQIDNLELVKRIMELQQQVFAQQDENRALIEEVRTLRAKLETRDQLAFRKNAYWRGEEGPFCSRCFDAEGLVVRLIVQQGYSPKCPKCETFAPDPERKGPTVVGPGRRSPWS
jgi:hypothetical protein